MRTKSEVFLVVKIATHWGTFRTFRFSMQKSAQSRQQTCLPGFATALLPWASDWWTLSGANNSQYHAIVIIYIIITAAAATAADIDVNCTMSAKK